MYPFRRVGRKFREENKNGIQLSSATCGAEGRLRSAQLLYTLPRTGIFLRQGAFRFCELKNWQFGYFPSLPEDALGAALPHAVKVPHCWQRDGFGKDMYSNIAYPFPYDPPHIDGENACGIYETVECPANFPLTNAYRQLSAPSKFR